MGKDPLNKITLKLTSENIATVSFLGGDEAIHRFGKQGKNGVLEVITKSYKAPISSREETIPMNKDSLKESTKPLFVIDGVVIPEGRANNIDPNDIKEITVLKKEEDVKEYGEAGKNGVILISTKNGNFKLPKVVIDSDLKDVEKTKPLIVINGKITTDKVVSDIDPDIVSEVQVYKGEAALSKYGDKGINGVVEITTKNQVKQDGTLVFINGEVMKNEKDTKGEDNKFTHKNFVGKTYSMSSEMAKEKVDINGFKGQVDFRFTEPNNKLEGKMPINFELFSNPNANNRVEFKYSVERIDNIQACIFDMSGALLKKVNIMPTGKIGRSTIELPELSNGVYLLRLNQTQSSVTNRFILF